MPLDSILVTTWLTNFASPEKRWDEEITKDLQEFEVVGGSGSEVCDEELEKDLAALSTAWLTTPFQCAIRFFL